MAGKAKKVRKDKNNKPVLSVGIIFKNEIRCIERCLQSLQPLREAVSCEVVMADTGSDDGSREVAEQYADIVIDFPWINDFAAARNAVMDRCSGKWYLSLDCDEWLDKDAADLVDFLTHPKRWAAADAAFLTIRNYLQADLLGDYEDFLALRFLRMSTGIRFQGAIHEQWIAQKDESAFVLQSPILHHDGYVGLAREQGRAKRERNMALLREALEREPDNLLIRLECYDSCEENEKDYYIRHAVEGVEQRLDGWLRWGPAIYRNAVSRADQANLPEAEDWIRQARGLFWGVLCIRLDVSAMVFHRLYLKKQYAEAIPYGEEYLAALKDYREGKCSPRDLTISTLWTTAPNRELLLRTFLADACVQVEDYPKARDQLAAVDVHQLNKDSIAYYFDVMVKLQSRGGLEMGPMMADFWENIGKPQPSEEQAKKRRDTVKASAAKLFTREYRDTEDAEGIRHAYTLFLPLEGQCSLGQAAAILETTDPQVLEEKLAAVERWKETPIYALSHALTRGAAFPPPGKPMMTEELETLARRLTSDKESLIELAITAKPTPEDVPSLCWARALVMAAVQVCDWTNQAHGMALARSFSEMEKVFLPLCYAPSALTEGRLFLLPPMHRFGWYCVQAFDALDSGDTVGYVRLLRTGLETSPAQRTMVEFLVEHTPTVQEALSPPPELAALANQVQTILARFEPDDPMVAELKASEAYQKVAYLLTK